MTQEERAQLEDYLKRFNSELDTKNMSNEDMIALTDYYTQTGQVAAEPDTGLLEATGLKAADVLTADNAAEIAAGAAAPFSNKPYSELKNQFEAYLAKAAKDQPGSIPLGQVAGIAGSAYLPFPKVAAVTKFGPKVNALLTAMKQGAVPGAVYGAAADTGEERTALNAIDNALSGATVGSLLSGAGEGISMGAQKLGQYLARLPYREINAKLFKKNPEGGENQFSQLIEQYNLDGSGFEKIRAALEDIASTASSAVSDVKKSLTEKGVGVEPRSFSKKLQESLGDREGQMPSIDKISSYLSDTLSGYRSPEFEQKLLQYKDLANAYLQKAKEAKFYNDVEKALPPGTLRGIPAPVVPNVPILPKENYPFSRLSDYTQDLQQRAKSAYKSIQTGETSAETANLYKKAAAAARKERNALAEANLSPEEYAQYLANQSTLGKIEDARKPVLSAIQKQMSSPVLNPFEIASGVGFLGGALLPEEYGKSYGGYLNALSAATLAKGLANRPLAANIMGKTLTQKGIGNALRSSLGGSSAAIAGQAIPYYLQPNEEPQP